MNSENMTQFPTRFISYPTNRLVAHFETRKDVKKLLSALKPLDVDIGSIYILDGQEGLEALDPSGEKHGTLGKISRAVHQAGSSTEREKFQGAVNHLSKGGVTVAIYAKDKILRDALVDLYKIHGGEDITYTALFYIEDFHSPTEASEEKEL